MKDSFIFEGKKYISARRASEISDYSSDYIGQLCRAEKLDCRMVGRSWFVTEESLHLHKASVLHDEVYRNRIQNLRGKKSDSSASSVKTVDNANAASTANTASVVDATNIADVAVATNAAAVATVSTEVAPLPVVVTESPIKYFADDRPLLPQMTKHEEVSVAPVVEITPVAPVVSEISVEKTVKVAPSIISPYFNKYAKSVALGVFIFVVSVVAVSFVWVPEEKIVAENESGLTASVMDAVDSFFMGIRNGYKTVAGLFRSNIHLSVNIVDPAASSRSFGMPAGMAVAPSSGDASADEEMKKQIQNTFSDEVEVRADKSGTSGVITPVFKESKGKDFIYVMVPVKDQETSP